MEFISPEGLRQDGRRPHELRQLQCELGVLPKADGSAMFEMGNTKVLAAVSGPKAGAKQSGMATGGHVKSDVAIAAFCQTGNLLLNCIEIVTGLHLIGDRERRRRTRRDRRVQDLRSAVQATLEQVILLTLMPRSQIEVFVQVLQADGGERAACINAAVLAVANAGVPMRDLAAACTVGYLESTALLDINLTEVNGQGPQTILTAYPNLDQVVFLESSGGNYQIETMQEIHELAMEGAKAVAQYMRTALLTYTTKLAVCHG